MLEICKLNTDNGVPPHRPGNHSDHEAEISRKTQYTVDQLAKNTTTSAPEVLRTISILDATYWIDKGWELMEPATIQKCFAKACFLHTVSDEFTCDSPDDNEIPLSMLRLSNDLFSCGYEMMMIDVLRPLLCTR